MAAISPDDLCGVCSTKRDEHGDKNHEFNLEGELIPKKKPEPARQSAPQPRGSGLNNDPVARLQIRLVERLVSKGLLEGDDLVYIFGGENENHRGQTGATSPEGDPVAVSP